MSRRLTAAVAVASALVLAAPVASAQDTTVVRAKDATGDVKVIDAGSLSSEQLRSIDLRRVKVKLGAESTRFVVKIARFTTSKKFEQMVFITLKSPNGADPAYETYLGMSAQSPKDSYANYVPDITGEDIEVCDPLTAVVKRGFKTLTLDVPHRCIPEGPVKIRVTSATGAFRSEGPGNSRDALRIKGAYVLK